MDAVLARFSDSVRAAAADGGRLRLRGGGSKDFLGGPLAGELLDTRGYCGIVEHDPGELILRARCGTPLAEVEALLRAHGQLLPFDPPQWPGATLGGALAAGLAGPLRASFGPARDCLLGVRLMNGRGALLVFGGPVIKNVAGYDVARLMAGACGVLGILLDLTLRLVPAAAQERTHCLELGQHEAIVRMNQLLAAGTPLLASAWYEGVLYLRIGGARAAVEQSAAGVGGTLLNSGQAGAWWQALREQQPAVFTPRHASEALWRITVPATTPPLALPGSCVLEWAGAQRWLRCDAPPTAVQAAAQAAGGRATLFRGGSDRLLQCAPVATAALRIQQRLKKVFDPAGVFNPQRLHPEI